jgi:hypothetical protein
MGGRPGVAWSSLVLVARSHPQTGGDGEESRSRGNFLNDGQRMGNSEMKADMASEESRGNQAWEAGTRTHFAKRGIEAG